MILKLEDPNSETTLIETLAKGGIAVVPCDTIYGILGIVPDTEMKIREIKGRGEDKPFLQLLSSVKEIRALSRIPVDERVLGLLPGPLTLVLPLKSGDTVAVRMPDDAFLLRVIKSLGKRLYSTSVNFSGSPPCNTIGEIVAGFADRVDLILDGGDIPNPTPSTILDVTAKPYRILRQGACAVPVEMLA